MDTQTSTRRYKKSFISQSFLVVFLIAYFFCPSFLRAFVFDVFKSERTNAEIHSFSIKENSQTLPSLGQKDIYKFTDRNIVVGNLSLLDISLSPKSKIFEEGDQVHDESVVYTVKKGDSLASIAKYFEVDIETIATFNKLGDKKIEEGDTLEIPSISGILYIVAKGDTLEKIAKKYDVDLENVSLYNGISPSEELSIGDEIFLPGAKKQDKDPESKTRITKQKNISKSLTTQIKKTTGIKSLSDIGAIVKVRKNIGRYSDLPNYEGYFANPAPGSIRTQRLHGNNGVDLAAPVGTPILASAAGTVVVARDGGWNYGYGKYIVISHPNGTQTLYAHLSSVDVSVGDNVSRGQRIGGMGSSGRSTGPHLHFEIRGAFNPFAW